MNDDQQERILAIAAEVQADYAPRIAERIRERIAAEIGDGIDCAPGSHSGRKTFVAAVGSTADAGMFASIAAESPKRALELMESPRQRLVVAGVLCELLWDGRRSMNTGTDRLQGRPADQLREIVKAGNRWDRAAAVYQLAELDPAAHLDAIVAALADQEPDVRRQAIYSLGCAECSAQSALPKLLRISETDPDADCRRLASEACTKIANAVVGSKRAMAKAE